MYIDTTNVKTIVLSSHQIDYLKQINNERIKLEEIRQKVNQVAQKFIDDITGQQNTGIVGLEEKTGTLMYYRMYYSATNPSRKRRRRMTISARAKKSLKAITSQERK